jgi:hypothetical protein
MTSATPAAPGRSIRLFLADGTADGTVTADMGNWVGKVLSAPRPRVNDLLRRPECARTGIYIMVGPDPERAGATMAYVGEADNVAARMRYHVSSGDQDFFDRVAVVVSSDDNLTKTHARYLESQLIRATRAAGSLRLTNTREPDFRRLPEADRADMDYFVAQLRLVLPILGYDLFRQSNVAPVPAQGRSKLSMNRSTFVFEPVGASAQAIETDEGFVVLAGSTARRGETSTFPAGYLALRERLTGDGALATDGDRFRFERDVQFTSPSAAAAIVAGRSASGPGEWRTIDGQTYRELKAAELQTAATVLDVDEERP